MSYKIVCDECENAVSERSAVALDWWDVSTGGYGKNRKEFAICSNECLKEWVAGLVSPPAYGGIGE